MSANVQKDFLVSYLRKAYFKKNYLTLLQCSGKNCEKSNLCAASPCKNGGTCSIQPNGNKFKCICPLGFKGTTCSEDVQECNNNPCKHGGTCLNTHGSYQ